MYSTTTLAKNTKLTGKIVGTHQQIDRAARKILGHQLPRGRFFPAIKDIRHFSGALGPDGLKRKSPDEDDPSHMFDGEHGTQLVQQILDHHYNLVQALKKHDEVRAAFEAAWLAHKVVDALTPAHHFPLSEAKEELMANKDFVKIFGAPIKGIMHGRSIAETARNNWLYWGAGGYFSKHVAYEYGVVILTTVLPLREIMPMVGKEEFCLVDPQRTLFDAIDHIRPLEIYNNFRRDGWTTELALETKNLVLPEIIRAVALIWYSAAEEAYGLHRARKEGA